MIGILKKSGGGVRHKQGINVMMRIAICLILVYFIDVDGITGVDFRLYIHIELIWCVCEGVILMTKNKWYKIFAIK